MDLIMAKERRERPQLSLDVGCGTYPETILVRLRMVVLFHLGTSGLVCTISSRFANLEILNRLQEMCH